MSRERRAHARVAVPLDARVLMGNKEIPLTVREISRTGIFLYTKEPPGRLGAVLTLKLSIVAGIRALTLDAQVVRVAKDQAGTTLGIALRFIKTSPQQEQSILELIDRAMNGRGTGPRAFPRISFLLNVRCTSTTELEALLRDIGEGGAGLELFRPLTPSSEVLVEIELPGREAMQLGGFVASCEPEEGGKYRAGIRFRKLSPELREELNGFLRGLYRQ